VSLAGGIGPNNDNNNFHLILKLTECSMITSIVRMDDHKLLQELNLTVQQPRRTPITFHVTCSEAL